MIYTGWQVLRDFYKLGGPQPKRVRLTHSWAIWTARLHSPRHRTWSPPLPPHTFSSSLSMHFALLLKLALSAADVFAFLSLPWKPITYKIIISKTHTLVHVSVKYLYICRCWTSCNHCHGHEKSYMSLEMDDTSDTQENTNLCVSTSEYVCVSVCVCACVCMCAYLCV